MATRSVRSTGPIIAGAVALSVGAFVPWLRTSPDLAPDALIPTILIPGMHAGVQTFDYLLLATAALVALPTISDRLRPMQGPLALLGGAGTVLFCVSYLAGSTLAGFDATFVPALGWYLAVLGGVLLVVGGGVHVPDVVGRARRATR